MQLLVITHGIQAVKEVKVIVKIEIMETESTKLVRFMNWYKKTYPHGTRKTSTMIVQHYIKNPDEKPEEEPDPTYAHMDGEDTPAEKRFCKGCHADVSGSMYCHCGDFGLLKSETLSETELNNLENGRHVEIQQG